MFLFERKQPKKTNYGKIIAITLAVVGGTCAVAYVVYRLFVKFFSLCDCDCGDDFLEDDCYDCCDCCDCDCEECDDECDDKCECECSEAEA